MVWGGRGAERPAKIDWSTRSTRIKNRLQDERTLSGMQPQWAAELRMKIESTND